MIIHIKKHKTAIFIITLLSLILLPILVFTLNQTATIDDTSVCTSLENGEGIVIQDRESNNNQELDNYCFDQDNLVVFTCTDGAVDDTGSIYEANTLECAVGCSGGACIEDPADADANVCVFDEGERTAGIFGQNNAISNYCVSENEVVEVGCGVGDQEGHLVSEVVDCGENGVCDGGQCFQVVLAACVDDDECANGLSCVENFCKVPLLGGCDISAQCIDGHVCSGGECKVEEGGACGNNNPCAALLLCDEAGTCAPDVVARERRRVEEREARGRMFGEQGGASASFPSPAPIQQDSASGQAGAGEESATTADTQEAEGETLQAPVAEEAILDRETCRILE